MEPGNILLRHSDSNKSFPPNSGGVFNGRTQRRALPRYQSKK